ncbi:uncharacterized protein LOC143253213 [Tachypleus tridentatus]|uniref:uncharacterized protein LOC143253213 n=1 Tax=Tachypleus tridentatus TaxID=6853 RepID=UPI003FD6AEA3
MASSNCEKRKYEDENRNFKPEGEEDFAFTVKRVHVATRECKWWRYIFGPSNNSVDMKKVNLLVSKEMKVIKTPIDESTQTSLGMRDDLFLWPTEEVSNTTKH